MELLLDFAFKVCFGILFVFFLKCSTFFILRSSCCFFSLCTFSSSSSSTLNSLSFLTFAYYFLFTSLILASFFDSVVSSLRFVCRRFKFIGDFYFSLLRSLPLISPRDEVLLFLGLNVTPCLFPLIFHFLLWLRILL